VKTASVLAVLVLAGLCVRGAGAAEDPREVEARVLFAKGDYPRALDVFARLFAEKSDPIYLRNIGRCHQMLKQPDPAIDAFREYLRRAKVRPAERREVEGFIAEMETLRAQTPAAKTAPTVAPAAREEAVAPVATPAPPPETAAPAPLPTAPAPTPTLEQPALAPSPSPAGPAPDAEVTARSERPIAARWWFWAGVGAVLLGGAAAALALHDAGKSIRPPCPMPYDCP
jgi:hypothetical protein